MNTLNQPGISHPPADQTSPRPDTAECEGCGGPLTTEEAEAARSTGFRICTYCIEAVLSEGVRP
jgi:hypothetical protein